MVNCLDFVCNNPSGYVVCANILSPHLNLAQDIYTEYIHTGANLDIELPSPETNHVGYVLDWKDVFVRNIILYK